ncbi:MAG: beta-N-acetylhexosaminidase [Gammaproteobacteria bacterium]|nr:beta-N-acetylhexosaminidase [Gammaproteobacteria bacterium]
MKKLNIGQVMLDVEGLSLSPEDEIILQHPQVGGFILFRRNYSNKKQVSELISHIKSINPNIIIAVDQEGGRVQRFIEGFTRLAPLGDLGNIYSENPEQAFALVKDHALTMANELIDVGVDLSFTPVLDRNIGVSSVIGDRSFHAETDVIVALAGAYISAMHEAGMPATGKHFPGHGAVVADSHIDLPVDTRDFATICATDLVPFKALASQLDAVMIAHVVYQQVSDLPAGFDHFWLNDVLRDQCGFEGVVFSDALDMGALKNSGSMSQRADLALQAGCDMVLVCNDRAGAIEVLEHLGDKFNPIAQQRIQKLLNRKSAKTELAENY